MQPAIIRLSLLCRINDLVLAGVSGSAKWLFSAAWNGTRCWWPNISKSHDLRAKWWFHRTTSLFPFWWSMVSLFSSFTTWSPNEDEWRLHSVSLTSLWLIWIFPVVAMLAHCFEACFKMMILPYHYMVAWSYLPSSSYFKTWPEESFDHIDEVVKIDGVIAISIDKQS
jgi:hypothetical protein